MRLMIQGKYAGNLQGDTLTKKGRQVVLFRAFDGFGMSRHVLNNPRVKRIVIYYKELIYRATAEKWLKQGIPYHKAGFEPQVVLPRAKMQRINTKQGSLL